MIRVAVVNDADACARDVAAALRRRLPRFTVEATAMSSRDAKHALYHREIEASVIAGLPHPPRCRWNQADRATRVRFVGRPRVRDLVVQWRASWSGPAAKILAEIAHGCQRDAMRAANPPVDPWRQAREFLRGPLAPEPVSPEPPVAEDPDALEIDFDERGHLPVGEEPPLALRE